MYLPIQLISMTIYKMTLNPMTFTYFNPITFTSFNPMTLTHLQGSHRYRCWPRHNIPGAMCMRLACSLLYQHRTDVPYTPTDMNKWNHAKEGRCYMLRHFYNCLNQDGMRHNQQCNSYPSIRWYMCNYSHWQGLCTCHHYYTGLVDTRLSPLYS